MHAEQLLHIWLLNVLPEMHGRRRSALGAAMTGVLFGGRLAVTALGRSLLGSAKKKHNIKRVDRLLSNKHLQSETTEIYRSLAHQFVGEQEQPIILVDWSDVDGRREFFLLRSSLAVRGRSITLYEEVHGRETKEKRSTHNQFLENLKKILPEDCKAIIVTDAGFRNPWFKKVLELGWDFVGRVRNREMVKHPENTEWTGAKSLYKSATGKAKNIKETMLTRSNPLNCTLVLYKSKPKGRVLRGKLGKKKRNRTSLVNSQRAKEPWLLATSLSVTAKKVVTIYSARMQIEESFRDLKCPRFGLGLYQNGTYKIERLRLLILIGSLATAFALLLGKATKLAGEDRQFQANTTTSTSVLSFVFIGIQVFRDWRMRLSLTLFREAEKHIQFIAKGVLNAC